jgi:hypothetical protein
MTDKKTPVGYSIDELLSQAKAGQPDAFKYANYLQLNINTNELIMDFYHIANTVSGKSEPVMTHIQRMIMPNSLAKAVIDALQETVEKFESVSGRSLGNSRNE